MTDSVPIIISRADAKALGFKRYFVGESCRRSHICERMVSDDRCFECNKIYESRRGIPKKTIKQLKLEAQEKGLKTFNTGKPCDRGHTCDRWVRVNNQCIDCEKEDFPDGYRYEGKVCERCGTCTKNKYRRCIKCDEEGARKRYPRYSDRRQKYNKEKLEKHPEYSQNYRRQNRGLYNMHASKRRALSAKASLPLNEVDTIAMRDIYTTCPAGWCVDHVVPLKNKLVCGLNVPWNLQHLSRHDNAVKKNRFPYDEESEKLAVRQSHCNNVG